MSSFSLALTRCEANLPPLPGASTSRSSTTRSPAVQPSTLTSKPPVQRVCRRAVAAGIVHSAHDCSDGGLAVALAESCIAGEIGFIGSFDWSGRWDAAFFGETESRIVVSLPEDRLTQLVRLCSDEGVPTVVLGRVGGSRLVLGRVLDLDLREADNAWSGGLEWAVGGADASLGSRL